VSDLPIACTLSPDGMTARLALIDALAADGLLDRTPTATGVRVRITMSPLRLTLVALLVGSTALFAVGVVAERSQAGERAEPAGAQPHGSGGSVAEPEGAHEEGEGERANGAAGASAARTDEAETLLGVDIESSP
jgi:hypothetical protein